MHKDSKGNYISEHSVVVTDFNNGIYSVECVDRTREFNIKLRNGCVTCYAKPEQLTRIDNLGDLK